MSTPRRAPSAVRTDDDVPVPAQSSRTALRHSTVALTSLALTAVFWFGRLNWEIEMRTWRAFGDAAVVLLFASLVVGPLARIWRPAGVGLRWRRELGVWFAVMAVVHAILVINGWVQWDLGRLMGYEFVPQLGRTARMEPGFGLANLVGLVALVWTLVLAATSSNRAVRVLGPQAWKWLHHGSYVVFYLAVLHTVYFLFMHYTLSFHREPPPPNWFRWPLLVMGVTVAALQWTAFVITVRRRRREPGRSGRATTIRRRA